MEVNLYLIQAIFEDDSEVQVDIESDSTKVFSLLGEDYPDVLVLDLMMPNVDGFQLLQEINDDPDLNQIPILIVSARLDNEAYRKAMSYGVQGFIKKPIQMNEVEEKVRYMFSLELKNKE